MKNIKKDFPIFKNNPGLVYLDNAASAQKPVPVIEAVTDFYGKYNANIHRGIHKLSELATTKYEDARQIVADFINAEPEEIIFTAGTTDSLNSLAIALEYSGLLRDNPTIITTKLEHHSNILPWTRIRNAQMKFLDITNHYQIALTETEGKNPGKQPDLISITHMSNVTGTITEPLTFFKKFPNAVKVLDAAQSVPHIKIDVKKLGADFIAFSGHKLYGPTGIGVLYGKKDLLAKLPPLKLGGGMIREVHTDPSKNQWAGIPEKHEAGTPQIAQAIGLAEAVKYIQRIGFKDIEKQEHDLQKYMFEKLKEIDEIELYHPELGFRAGAVFSFNIKGIHAHDTAQLLSDKQIAVRAGHHCTQILHRDVLKRQGSVRASFGLYNTREDADQLIKSVKDVIYKFNVK